ncbi:hypothetical protein CDD81_3268 [Ophiocordyceps australis]|uniref:Uncharacterized protein n=1 Tax=Ophiocordyceps australis TaxID=1399860 RepID=A0A2C5Y8U8_9HYPO|nr:hypothetical protein CDD81_3268 [Ophiocordyceps australis]
MKPASTPLSLLSALRGLSIFSPACLSPSRVPVQPQHMTRRIQNVRAFSTTTPVCGTWLEPKLERTTKMPKGRPKVFTGGSTRGTTVVWGDWGMRITDHHRRISATSLKTAEDTIKTRLRGQKYFLYKRKNCCVGVFASGSDMRMGKGKGSFDHWATRISVYQVLFEIKGDIHEQIVRDAFRLAGNKLPGQWEFVRKGDPPVVGITKLDGVTLEELKRPRRKIAPVEMLEAAPPSSVSIASSTSNAPPQT